MNTRSTSRKKKQAKCLGVPPFLSNQGKTKGRTKKISYTSRDGMELKIYLATGCVPGGYGINELVEKYPQFLVYEKSSLSSAFNRLKKNANSIAFERGNRKNGKL